MHADSPGEPRPDAHAPFASAVRTMVRRAVFLSAFLFLAGTGILLLADFLWRTGLYGLKYGLLVLTSILFALISFVFCSVLLGFLSAHLSRRLRAMPAAASAPAAPLPPTAVVFPVHDEEVAGVAARVEAVWKSLLHTGRQTDFHVYVLSDSRNPERWIEEEIAWFHVAHRLRAVSNVHYRHRSSNEGFKAGNLTDFLEHWGGNYRYMIVLDADSLMSGRRMVQLVERMEAQPQVGIMQTVPAAIRGRSLYACLEQFASRLYSPLFMAGLDFWQAGDANYFGHNAIVRVQPFMANCRLPRLPWREPLGGQIFSHDFVEAALMRRAGWEVRTVHIADGSYEEAPANMLENLRRQRRWCQGNLQHAWLLFSHELPVASRTNFLLGILAFVSSPLWLLSLIFSTLIVVQFKRSGLTLISTSGFTPLANLSLPANGALLFGFCAFLLFGPKLLCLIDALGEPERRRLFGGARRAAAGVLLESLFSILTAPMFMFCHSLFVLTIPFGKNVVWGAQNRATEQQLPWREAARRYGPMTLTGLVWEALLLPINPVFACWMLPVLGPMALSIPLNVIFSLSSLGDRLHRAGLLQTPEITEPPQELRDFEAAETLLRTRLQRMSGSAAVQAVVDPYVNALHGELQQQPYTAEAQRDRVDGELARRLLRTGRGALSREQLFAFLLDSRACRSAHLQLWRTPDADLAPEWRAAIAAYAPNRQPALLGEDAPNPS